MARDPQPRTVAKEIRHNFAWGLAVERHGVQSEVVTQEMVERKATDEEQDLLSIGRPCGLGAKRCQSSFSAAECRYQEQTATATLGPKHERAAVRRPRRLRVVGRRLRHLHGLASPGQRLHPDVEVASAIGGIRDELAVR